MIIEVRLEANFVSEASAGFTDKIHDLTCICLSYNASEYLPTTVVVQAEQAVGYVCFCVCLCVWTVASEPNFL